MNMNSNSILLHELIFNEASMSVGSFYSYFNNKEEILIQIFEEISNMSMEAASERSRISKNNIN